jgi:hypothetical protein
MMSENTDYQCKHCSKTVPVGETVCKHCWFAFTPPVSASPPPRSVSSPPSSSPVDPKPFNVPTVSNAEAVSTRANAPASESAATKSNPAPQRPKSTPSHVAQESHLLDTARVKDRYRDAYLVANTTVVIGGGVKVVASLAAIVIGLFAVIAAGVISSNGGSTAIAVVFAVLGLIIAALCGGVLYLIGILLSANGQHLQASLDEAVNTSPFLSVDGKAEVMSL